jgi:hypothetical protein
MRLRRANFVYTNNARQTAGHPNARYQVLTVGVPTLSLVTLVNLKLAHAVEVFNQNFVVLMAGDLDGSPFSGKATKSQQFRKQDVAHGPES